MYYKLSDIVQHKYPQVECLTPFVVGELSPWQKLNVIYPELKYNLKKGVILTDLLSTACGPGIDCLISPKFLGVLKQFKLPYYQVLKSTIHTKKGIADYDFLHFYGLDMVDRINYTKSVFYESEWGFRRKGPIELESFDHYLALKKLDTKASFGVGYDKIVLNEDFHLDLFFMFPFGIEVYVSEELRARLIAENITGIILEETDKVIKP